MDGERSDAIEAGAPRAVPRFVLAAGLVGTLLLAGFVGVRVKQAMVKKETVEQERATAQAAILRKPRAQTISPVSGRWKAHVDLTGTLKPWRDSDVGFELGGRLVRVDAAVGDRVSEGAPLAVLDASRSLAQASAAEAQARAAGASLAIAEDNLKRTDALVASKSIPEAQAEQARQQVALARAQLEAAQAQAHVAQTGAGLHTIRAPFTGIVTRAPNAAGGVVQPGAPLVHVEDTSRLRLSATLGEDEVQLVALGAPVRVTYRDRSVTGKITAIVPSLDPGTRRAPVEVEVPNDAAAPLLAWSFVRARIEGKGEVSVLRVPATARRPGSQDEVVRVEDGKARIVHVTHLVDDDGTWVITGGLAASDVLLAQPDTDLHDGDPVDLPSGTPGATAGGAKL
jgi:RND family efflux transporter MFP subunit